MQQLNVEFHPDFLPEPEKFLDALEKEIRYFRQVKIYNRYFVPRLMAAYGDNFAFKYTFSGLTVRARPWTPALRDIKRMVEAKTDCKYNFCLVNKYRDGRDSIGRHKDDEDDLVPDSPIACVSLGRERTFRFSRPGCKSVEYQTLAGSLLVMKPPTNSHWFHEIPKEPNKEGVRVSLTFRKLELR